MDFLVFRLYGPLVSWGDVSVGEVRKTCSFPTRSAVLGLIGAALGIRRTEVERIEALRSGLGMAVRVILRGVLSCDFHTAQVPRAARLRNRGRLSSRQEELSAGDLETIVSVRDYLCDALADVAVWNRPGTATGVDLGDLLTALEEPAFHLYLGRKSCPPALPLAPRIVSRETVLDALKDPEELEHEFLAPLYGAGRGAGELYWETEANAGLAPVHVFTLRDEPLSRTKWTFGVRDLCHAPFPEEE